MVTEAVSNPHGESKVSQLQSPLTTSRQKSKRGTFSYYLSHESLTLLLCEVLQQVGLILQYFSPLEASETYQIPEYSLFDAQHALIQENSVHASSCPSVSRSHIIPNINCFEKGSSCRKSISKCSSSFLLCNKFIPSVFLQGFLVYLMKGFG